MNKEQIINHLNYIKNDKYCMEFYIALLLYERFNISSEDISDELINDTFEIIDKYDSIYEEFLRYDLDNELKKYFERERTDEIEKDLEIA